MPALPVIPNGFLIAQQLIGSPFADHPFINRFCVVCTGSSDRAAIAEQFADSYADTLLSVISAAIQMGATEVTPLDGTSTTLTVNTAQVGTNGGHTVNIRFPWALALGTTWQSAQRGRSHRGRTYLPGVDGDMLIDEGTKFLKTTVTAALQAAATGFISDLVGGTPSLVLQVLSRHLGVATPVIGARANNAAVMQRRRYERVAHD
jgi:hypothetical protein